jgi:hypothetical protein
MKSQLSNYIFCFCLLISLSLFSCMGSSPTHLSNETDSKKEAGNASAMKLTSPDTIRIVDDDDSLQIIYQTIQKDNENKMLLKVIRNNNELFSRTVSREDIFTDNLPVEAKIIMKHYYYTYFDKKNKELIFTIDTEHPNMEVTVVVDLKGNLEVVAE